MRKEILLSGVRSLIEKKGAGLPFFRRLPNGDRSEQFEALLPHDLSPSWHKVAQESVKSVSPLLYLGLRIKDTKIKVTHFVMIPQTTDAQWSLFPFKIRYFGVGQTNEANKFLSFQLFNHYLYKKLSFYITISNWLLFSTTKSLRGRKYQLPI